MAELNKQLTAIAQETITEMRGWGWSDDDIQWSAAGAILKHAEAHELIGEPPTKEDMAAIVALVKQCLKERTN